MLHTEPPPPTATAAQFDVFLSHNGRDKPIVERLAERLKRARLEPWLDSWCLVPGADWQQGLADGLSAARSCAVLVGPADLGAWANQEVSVALDRAAKDPAFRVFLVLLPGVPDQFDPTQLSPFLRMRTWVDYRGGLDDERAFKAMVSAIQGVPLGPSVPLVPDDRVTPYRGLEVFEEEHADFFFGRDADVQRLLEKLKTTRFLAVLGASGSGKSSLVRAGVVPALRTADWSIAVMRPGAHPLEALAANLVRVGAGVSMHETLDALATDPRTLHLAATLALVEQPRLLLVVDQFEEVFTLCRDEDERRAFFANLLYAATIPDGKACVLVAMRADFYHRNSAYPELAQQLAAEQYLVSPLQLDGLRQAVEEPARRVGLTFEPGLVDTIVEDVAEQPGGLPLLEHALLELWRRRAGGTLTLAGYRETGGVEGAIAKRAEQIFEAFEPEQQELARRTFLRLTQPGEGTDDTRRRAHLAELSAGDAVLGELVDARLLTMSRDAGGGELVEVAHEALIRGWPRLRAWVEEDRVGLRIHLRLTEAVREWERLGRDESALYRGARLAEALEWREQNDGSLNGAERGFLLVSEAAQRSELEAARRRSRRLRTLSLALAGLLAVALVAVVWALRKTDEANTERRVAESRALASAALARADDAPDLAMLVALEAYRLVKDAPAADRFDARNSLVTTLQRNTRLQAVLTTSVAQRAVALSPDGTTLASGAEDGTIRLWNVAGRRMIGEPLKGHRDSTWQLAFSPDGTTLASGGNDGTVRLWDVRRRVALAVFGRSPEPDEPSGLASDEVVSVAFSHDGKTLASARNDNTVQLWDVAGRRARGAPIRLQTNALDFSPNDRTLVLGGGDGTVRLWDVARRAVTGRLERDRSGVVDIALSPDGRTLITDGDAVWDVVNRRRSGRLESTGDTERAEFSPDGRTLATLGSTGALRLWDARSREPIEGPLSHSLVRDLAFSPRGGILASAGDDGTIRLWDARRYAPLGQGFPGRKGRFGTGDGLLPSLAISPDGSRIVVTANNGTVWIWSVDRASAGPTVLKVDKTIAFDAVFGPSGRLLVTAGQDDGIRFWDVDRRTEDGRTIAATAFDVAVSPDGKTLATARFFRPGQVELWHIVRRARIGTAFKEGSRRVAFSPDGRTLAVAGADGTLRLWDVARRAPVGRTLEGHTGFVEGLAFSPDGGTLATGDQAGTVRLWNVADRTPIGGPLTRRDAGIESVVFTPDGEALATSDDRGDILLWDLARRAQLGDSLGGDDAMIATLAPAAGTALASVAFDGTVTLWDELLASTDYEEWRERLCATAGRNLTAAEWRDLIPDRPYPASRSEQTCH